MMSELIKLGSGWIKQSKNGDEYISIIINIESGVELRQNDKIMLFKNKNKTSENSPDYSMVLAPKGGGYEQS
jgi:uncharacterized protein (DUF736 family)